MDLRGLCGLVPKVSLDIPKGEVVLWGVMVGSVDKSCKHVRYFQFLHQFLATKRNIWLNFSSYLYRGDIHEIGLGQFFDLLRVQ